VTNAGLKVVAFSAVCEGPVRVVGKGDRQGVVERFESWQVGRLRSKDREGRAEEQLNAPSSWG
jgi:hypothetical protein